MKRAILSFPTSAGVIACCGLVIGGCTTTESPPTSTSTVKPDAATFVVPPDIAEHYADPLAASELREQALDLLVTLSKDPNYPQLRGNALEAMSVTPMRLAPLIPAGLKDDNAGVRSIAATMVGKIRLVDLAPAVRPLLDDPSPFVRASAIYALSKCNLQVDPSPLAGILLQDPSPRVRAHVAFLLGEIGDPSALGLLREAAKAPMARAAGAEVRLMQLQIAEAMVKLGDESQLGTIRAALYPSRSEDLEATALAAQIIGELHDKGSMDELILLTAKRSKQGQFWPAEIRLAAAGALARLGNNKGTFLADQYAGSEMPVLRAQAAFVYGQIGRPENLPKLAILMKDPAGIVMVAAGAAVVRMPAAPTPPGGT
jgi:HEAT repeat protein